MFDWVHQVPILSIVCYVPLIGALIVIFFMRGSDSEAIKRFATGVVTLDFLISLPLWFEFDPQGELFQFRESAAWITSRYCTTEVVLPISGWASSQACRSCRARSRAGSSKAPRRSASIMM